MALRNLPRGRKSGVYAPTLTIVGNLSGLTAASGGSFTINDGGGVVVGVSLLVTATAASAASFRVSLPEVGDLLSTAELIGVFTTSNGTAGIVTGDVSNNEASCSFTAPDTNPAVAAILFTYQIN